MGKRAALRFAGEGEAGIRVYIKGLLNFAKIQWVIIKGRPSAL